MAAIAARQGVSDADRKASEISADADARREILQNAAEYLQQARLYAQAGTLYEAAADHEYTVPAGGLPSTLGAGRGSAKADELRKKAKAFAAMRRMGESELAQDPARRVVQQLFAAALSGSKAREKIPALFVSTASAADVASALEALYRAVGPALESARENQIPPLRIVDGVLLQSEIAVEGDATAGFRLRVSGEQLNESTWHVVIEQGQARLVPPGTRASTVRTTDLNNLAWAAVAAGNVNQQALDDALLAVKRTKQGNAACLHTLATVYAEMGKTSEALDTLRRAVEVRGERIEAADWYVLGRIAEQYGLNEVAAGLYRKVPARQALAADDVYLLAQRRLRKVGK